MRYVFSDCVLDARRHVLLRGGAPVALEPQVFDLLHLLMRNPGRLVSRDESLAEVWNGRIVSESAISARIAAARKAVGDDGKAQRIIRTIARRGLKFVAEVTADTPLSLPRPAPWCSASGTHARRRGSRWPMPSSEPAHRWCAAATTPPIWRQSGTRPRNRRCSMQSRNTTACCASIRSASGGRTGRWRNSRSIPWPRT
ncbi:winged helix-turn-helix domain-containing protein [Ruegeria pomeroyi]|nr:winged helix-turn-helix domain-containing protein [Ruegeria pomeroyi]